MKQKQSLLTQKAPCFIDRARIDDKAFSLVEVILAVSLFMLLASALGGIFFYGEESTALSGHRIRAALFGEEAVEAVRNMRDESFLNLTDGMHGLAVSGNQWVFSGASDASDIFTRSTAISAFDARRKDATTTVTWNQNLQRMGSFAVQTYFTHWIRNFGNWGALASDGILDLPGNADMLSVVLRKSGASTYALATRASSGEAELYIINITDPSNIILTASLELGADANDIIVSGSHAVIASSANNQELQVIDISNVNNPVLSGSLDLPGNTDALSIEAVGSTVFLGRASSLEKELSTISIANPAVPALIGELELGGLLGLGADAKKMDLNENAQYLSVASTSNTEELFVISVSNPAVPVVTGSFDASGNSDGSAVKVFSNYAALGRANGEVGIVNLNNPAIPTLFSNILDSGLSVTDFEIGVGDIHLFTSNETGNQELQTITIEDPAVLSVLGSLSFGGTINSLAYDFDLNRVIAVGTNNAQEIMVVKPN